MAQGAAQDLFQNSAENTPATWLGLCLSAARDRLTRRADDHGFDASLLHRLAEFFEDLTEDIAAWGCGTAGNGVLTA